MHENEMILSAPPQMTRFSRLHKWHIAIIAAGFAKKITEQTPYPLLYEMLHLRYHLHDETGTCALGAALARIVRPGLTLYLHGDLGTGKTTLTRALIHASGHDGHVKSPTYTLAEPYAISVDGRTIELVHFDLYRMGSPEEFLDAGFREHFNDDSICIVEWPEKADSVLPPPDIAISLNVEGQGRDVELQALSDKGHQCLDRLHFAPNL
jgi:tRNA threonylcarbamoyladenosine biosynthesis protein TsaE